MTDITPTKPAEDDVSKAEEAFRTSLEKSGYRGMKDDKPWLTNKEGKKNIGVLAAASFFNDMGEEMARPYLPTFAVMFLAANPVIFALIISLEELVNRVVRPLGGVISDRFGRKPAIGGGYLAIAAYRAGVSISRFWYWLVPFVSIRQVSRALRNQSKEAMVTESVPKERRGRTFGYLNAFDTLGAVVGPLLGIAILSFLVFGYFEPHGDFGSYSAFRILFLVAALPTLISATIIFTMLKETRNPLVIRKNRDVYSDFWAGIKEYTKNRRLMSYTIANCLFAAGIVPMMAILTFVQLGGITNVDLFMVAVLFTIYNIVHALASYPAGIITDKWGRRSAQYFTDFFGVITMVSFIFATTPLMAVPGFVLYGIFEALWVTSRKSAVSDLAPEHIRAQSFGIFSFFYGLASFAAPILFTIIWMYSSPQMAFLVSALIVMTSAIFLLVTVKDDKEK
jgi:MFS family permease